MTAGPLNHSVTYCIHLLNASTCVITGKAENLKLKNDSLRTYCPLGQGKGQPTTTWQPGRNHFSIFISLTVWVWPMSVTEDLAMWVDHAGIIEIPLYFPGYSRIYSAAQEIKAAWCSWAGSQVSLRVSPWTLKELSRESEQEGVLQNG